MIRKDADFQWVSFSSNWRSTQQFFQPIRFLQQRTNWWTSTQWWFPFWWWVGYFCGVGTFQCKDPTWGWCLESFLDKHLPLFLLVQYARPIVFLYQCNLSFSWCPTGCLSMAVVCMKFWPCLFWPCSSWIWVWHIFCSFTGICTSRNQRGRYFLPRF